MLLTGRLKGLGSNHAPLTAARCNAPPMPSLLVYSALRVSDKLDAAWIGFASRHAGMRSLLPRHPQRSMEAHRAQVTATRETSAVSETRKLAAILVADIVGYSRLAGADEDRILARLRTLRSDLIDPILAVHHGRVVKRTGDGAIVEFRSVVDAVRCAIEVQSGLVVRVLESVAVF